MRLLGIEDISIDHALMEKTELGIVLPLDVGRMILEVGSHLEIWKKNENGM